MLIMPAAVRAHPPSNPVPSTVCLETVGWRQRCRFRLVRMRSAPVLLRLLLMLGRLQLRKAWVGMVMRETGQ